MKKKSRTKHFSRMDADELAKATKEFDLELIADEFGEPDAPARRALSRAKRKRGRPRRGRGAKVISVTVEKSLLTKTDRLARKLRVSRANLVERGLRKVLDDEAA
jgi:hypothetical protein